MNFKKKNNFITEEKLHYKMYKAGKHWLVAGITSIGVILSLAGTSAVVNADHSKSIIDNAFNISTSKVKPLSELSDGNQFGNIRVDTNNFAEYFNINGDASWSKETSTLTLTPDVTWKAGNATLKNKISINDPFSIKGMINLGNKSRSQSGADGIGIAFHTGANTLIGANGGCLGIAGLPNGFGFKLDTFFNAKHLVKNNCGTYDDPVRFNKPESAFGGFAYAKMENEFSMVHNYDGPDAPAQKIPEPANNRFLPFEVSYTGGQDRILTVKYDNNTWSRSINDWVPAGTEDLSFSITGSTGSFMNLQQFKINEFTYTAYGVVDAKFVDAQSNEVLDSIDQQSAQVGQPIHLNGAKEKIQAIEASGSHYLIGAASSDGTAVDTDVNTVNAKEIQQTVTYKFAKNKAAIKTKNITLYEGDDFNSKDCFISATDKDGSNLDFSKVTADTSGVNPNKAGSYKVNYSYTPTNLKGQNLPAVHFTGVVNVVPRKSMIVRYYDQNDNPIDERLLADIPDEMKPGAHTGKFGSKFIITIPQTIGNYYKFFRSTITNGTPLPPDTRVLTFDNDDHHISLTYRGVETNNLTVHFKNAKNGKLILDDKPRGNIGDSLDLSANGNYISSMSSRLAAEGYHYASPTELNGNTQPTSADYKIESNEVTVYVAGDQVDPKDKSKGGVIVHHYLEGSETKLLDDSYYGGVVGDIIKINLNDREHKAPAGYEQMPNQTFEPWTLKPNQGKEFTIKYRGVGQDNITIDFIDAISGETIASTKPQGIHHTGDELDLSSKGVAGILPPGYHFAEQNELNGHTQPGNVKYTTQEQRPKVYVVGDKIDDNAKNAVTIHHYLQKPDGTKTTTKVPGLEDRHVGGRVGEKRTFEPTAAPTGYTSVSTPVEWTFKANEGKVINFYYTADKQDNITIDFVDAISGEIVASTKPQGDHYTGDKLDLGSEGVAGILPPGYHFAEQNELNGHTQPGSVKYTTQEQRPKVYVVGDKIDKNATNAVTIHHYLQKSDGTKTTTKVPGLEDRHEGGRVGETKTFTPAAAPAGYTLKSQPVEWTFKANEGKVINFYYEAGEQNNIKVHFINVKNDKELVTDNPVGTTGSVLDLAPTADYVQGMLNSKTELKGYHYATGRELNGQTQSKNPTYTTSEQHVNVFVAGDKVSGDNAVSVQHRLKENGQLTDKPVPGMRDFSKDGYVGDEFTFKTDDREQQAPRGYKLVDGQADQLRTLGLTAPDPVIFYYEAIEQNNVTVAFVNTETGAVVDTDKPSGAFGSTLDLTPNGSYLANKIPSGYHYAKRGELKSGQQQPRNLTYTTEDQTVRVYIAADVISDDSEDAVTIHHYVKGTNDKVVGLDDIKRGGRYGETVTFKKDAPEHLAPKGYKMSDDQTDLSWTFGQQGGDRNLIFNYEKVDLNNITVKYVNIKNNQVILTENPAGKIGEVLNLHIGDDLELPRELVSGYKYPTTNELAGRTQATNPTYSSKDQEVTVYVTPKGFPTSAQMKIEYVNVNNSDDRNLSGIVWEVDLKGHYEGEPIDLNGSIWMKKQIDSSYDLRTVIPRNYHYAGKNELKNGQIQKEKLTYTNGTITIYVVGNWIDASDQEAPVITHRLNSYNGAFVPGLRDIRQGGRYGDSVMINVKDPIHRSRKYDPKKYSVDTDGSTKPIPSNGLIQTSFGKPIIIIYGR